MCLYMNLDLTLYLCHSEKWQLGYNRPTISLLKFLTSNTHVAALQE